MGFANWELGYCGDEWPVHLAQVKRALLHAKSEQFSLTAISNQCDVVRHVDPIQDL